MSIDVSVVMPVYNECQFVEEGVRRVMQVSSPDIHGLHLILVDDGSNDERGVVQAESRATGHLRAGLI